MGTKLLADLNELQELVIFLEQRVISSRSASNLVGLRMIWQYRT